ncbi:MAG: ArgE/DapE family deacylase [Anaerolineae bacterium]
MPLPSPAELLSQLVAIDSVNPDLVPGGAGEANIAAFVTAWLENAGLDVSLHEAAPNRPNVIAVAKGTGRGRSLMLNAHLDTVGVAGMESPFQPRIADGRLYGRGAYDMKGSLAACMLTMAAVQSMELAGDVIFTGVVDEEYASLGTQAIADRWKADAAIVTEPTAMQLCIAHKGFVWLEVETIGKAAHGSRPDLGVDAITKMGRVLVGLDQLAEQLQAGTRHPLLGTGSIHASLISGGQELSSYPERCRCQVERRTIPGETPAIVEAQIQAILDGVRGTDLAFQASLRTTMVRDSFEIADDAPIVTALREQAASTLHSSPNITGATFWMDSALLSAAGIPTVVFGPGGEGAHAVVEWVDLEQVAQCVEIYTATARAFCHD